MKSPESVDSIARRRRRLSIDYHQKTHTWSDAYSGDSGATRRAASWCLTKLRHQFLPHYFGNPPHWRVWVRQLLKDRVLPDFCVVGPGKSGTSDLAVTIMSHPNVLYPLVKEFASTDPLTWKPFYPTLRAVQRHAHRHGIALCPLVAPYLHCIDIPTSLSALRPDTKIIIALRNPVDLVFSEWKWTVLWKKKQLIDQVPFLASYDTFVVKLLEVFPEISLGIALHWGIYAHSVAHWLRAFGRHNVRVLDVAEYFKDRSAFLQEIEQFLGLPHVPLPQRLPVANQNPLDGFRPNPETSIKLRDFFEPYNRRLWDIIGTAYPW